MISQKLTNGNTTRSGRPPYGFVLLDFPSDHEIDGGLVTECRMISSLLYNRGMGSSVKLITISLIERFKEHQWKSYPKCSFVHISGHGSKEGLGFIGGDVSWEEIGNKIKIIAPKIKNKQEKRILCLSCCNSVFGYKKLVDITSDHFHGIYYFKNKELSFATAMTVWAMFYRKKMLDFPQAAVANSINKFFSERVILFG